MAIKNFTKLAVFGTMALSLAFGGFASLAQASIGVSTNTNLNVEIGDDSNDDGRNRGDNHDDYKKGGDTSDGRMYKGDDKKDDKDDWKKDENRMPGIMGTVSAINGTTLTVTSKEGTVYTVTTTDAKFQFGKGSTATLADIKIGDTVLVQGTVTGTNVAAKTVLDTRIAMEKFNEKKEGNNGNHYGFFARFGNFFKNIFKGKASMSINAAIAGNTYKLTSFNGTMIAVDQNYTTTFKDGKLNAKFCNSMGGDYSLKDGVIKANLVSTMMYCGTPSNLMTIESTFGKVTSEGGIITVDNTNTITLKGKSGEVFVFTKI